MQQYQPGGMQPPGWPAASAQPNQHSSSRDLLSGEYQTQVGGTHQQPPQHQQHTHQLNQQPPQYHYQQQQQPPQQYHHQQTPSAQQYHFQQPQQYQQRQEQQQFHQQQRSNSQMMNPHQQYGSRVSAPAGGYNPFDMPQTQQQTQFERVDMQQSRPNSLHTTSWSSASNIGAPQNAGPSATMQSFHSEHLHRQSVQSPSADSLVSSFDSSLLSSFGMIAPPKPIQVARMDAQSVSERLAGFHSQGKLTDYEFEALRAQTRLLPTKITLALDNLEQSGDRSIVDEILTKPPSWSSPSAPSAPAEPRPPPPASVAAQHYQAQQSKQPSSPILSPTLQYTEVRGVEDDSSDDEVYEIQRSSPRTEVDSEEEADFKLAKQLEEQFQNEAIPPHPGAAGYKKDLPSSFVFINGELLGRILFRVSTKKLFRKWKEMFFHLDKDNLSFYETNTEYEAQQPPRFRFKIHPCMYIRKPMEKHTYSMMDDGQKVFYTVLRENVPEETEHCLTYAYEKTSRKLGKLGGLHMDEISALSFAIHGCIIAKRRERSLGLTDVAGRYQ